MTLKNYIQNLIKTIEKKNIEDFKFETLILNLQEKQEDNSNHNLLISKFYSYIPHFTTPSSVYIDADTFEPKVDISTFKIKNLAHNLQIMVKDNLENTEVVEVKIDNEVVPLEHIGYDLEDDSLLTSLTINRLLGKETEAEELKF